jgi:hypothetical protein
MKRAMRDTHTQKHDYPRQVPWPPKGLSGGHLTIKKQIINI